MGRERQPPPPVPPPRGEHGIPMAFMVESIVGCKWSVRLIGLMANECHRPSALLRSCPGLSAKVLNERLRKLIRFDIVRRTVRGDKPPVEVEYRLTDFGRRFLRILDEVRRLQEAVDRTRGGGRLAATADGPDEERPTGRSGGRGV